jgi:hypothetical protein
MRYLEKVEHGVPNFVPGDEQKLPDWLRLHA